LAWSGRVDQASEVRREVEGDVLQEYWWALAQRRAGAGDAGRRRLEAAERAALQLEPYADTVAGLATTTVAIGPVA